jgi:hypothetical protein
MNINKDKLESYHKSLSEALDKAINENSDTDIDLERLKPLSEIAALTGQIFLLDKLLTGDFSHEMV